MLTDRVSEQILYENEAQLVQLMDTALSLTQAMHHIDCRQVVDKQRRYLAVRTPRKSWVCGRRLAQG